MKGRSAFLLAVVLVTATAAGCGASDSGGEHPQGIEGRYVITGPGMIQDCSEFSPGEERDACEAANEPWTRPVADAEIEVRDAMDRFVTRVTTDSEGKYRVPLAAGDYLLCDAGCDGPITVVAGAFTVYEISLAVP